MCEKSKERESLVRNAVHLATVFSVHTLHCVLYYSCAVLWSVTTLLTGHTIIVGKGRGSIFWAKNNIKMSGEL